ncbi:MAG: helix-turn-helix domain-containing protein, partial [Verrucomicrobia bacterium]|nr:helix-turn-helix domain-containing protein [Verrucomicrobiota bacterium]
MWRQAGYGKREIARRLGRSPSSICREVARNTGGNGYQPRQAHEMAQDRAKRPGPRRFTEEVKADAESRLQDGWTPDMISGRARLEGRPWVCKETIYTHIYA